MRQARRLLLASSPGLERCLERELQTLRVPGRLEVLPGAVLVKGTDETLWRAALQSRVADSVQLLLGEPFHAPDLRSLDAGLRALPWEDCLPMGGLRRSGDSSAGALELRVTAHRSRLFHTQLVEDRVRAALAERCASAASTGQPAGPAQAASVPQVSVRLRHDACQVSVSASGPLHRRGYRSGLGEPLLRETSAAACVLASPFLRRLAAATASGEDLLLWDPFCGPGAILLEALGIAMGQPPGDGARKYPFASFPCHSEREYEGFLGQLEATPHPAVSSLSLLGSDSTAAEVDRARRNLRRFQRRLWPPGAPGRLGQGAGTAQGDAEGADGPKSLPCSVDFRRATPASLARELDSRPMMLLTSLLRARGSVAGASQLGRLVLQRQADWRGVFCIATDADDARQQTGLHWDTELRFLNKGRWAELLQWTGRGSASR